MQVVIGGIEYVPAASAGARIGIAVTTHNRKETLKRALDRHLQFRPDGALLVVVDDGSAPAAVVPEGVELRRLPVSEGIVAAKNAALQALMDAGCEHLFLWDDDAWPVVDGWWRPYVESPEPHLAYQFLDLAGPRKLKDIAEIHRDERHVAYTGQRGVMLYYHRRAIEVVGGFDPIYGRGMYEHSDLALRIHNAGLTSWAFADVVGSESLIYSLDEHEEVTRSVPQAQREALVRRNAEIHNARRDSGYTGYAEYRTQVDVVLTTLLTSEPDPQRGAKWPADSKSLQAWASSIKGDRAVVLADELEAPPAGADLVRVPVVAMNVYYRRWLHIYQHLRAHPEYRRVWCTDGTDVVMLREPWADMEEGRIYVGSEPKTYQDQWAIDNHPARVFQDFLREHRGDVMLNAGLLGGSRSDVMEFAHRIVRLYYTLESQRFWRQEPGKRCIGDMIAFGVVAHGYGDRIVTGPQVHTVFRSGGMGKEYAWWQHK